jgi:regulator of protease activity HflC (stomatin/prohibitin superfamily)
MQDPLLALASTFVVIFVTIILFLIAGSVKVIKEYERAIIFRLGRFIGLKGPGLFWIIPRLDKIQKVDLRIVTYDARTIKVITKDNIRCDVDSFVFYRVVDPEKAVLAVENFVNATQNLAKTVLRDVLGQAELDDLLTHTEAFTLQIQQEIDEKTDPWGIKVSDVAISDIILPMDMQRAIAKQAEAERERRSRIIVAEGEFIAGEKMMQAAELYAKNPISIKLRELQTLSEIAREKNLVVVTSTTGVQELGDIVAFMEGRKKALRKSSPESGTMG